MSRPRAAFLPCRGCGSGEPAGSLSCRDCGRLMPGSSGSRLVLLGALPLALLAGAAWIVLGRPSGSRAAEDVAGILGAGTGGLLALLVGWSRPGRTRASAAAVGLVAVALGAVLGKALAPSLDLPVGALVASGIGASAGGLGALALLDTRRRSPALLSRREESLREHRRELLTEAERLAASRALLAGRAPSDELRSALAVVETREALLAPRRDRLEAAFLYLEVARLRNRLRPLAEGREVLTPATCASRRAFLAERLTDVRRRLEGERDRPPDGPATAEARCALAETLAAAARLEDRLVALEVALTVSPPAGSVPPTALDEALLAPLANPPALAELDEEILRLEREERVRAEIEGLEHPERRPAGPEPTARLVAGPGPVPPSAEAFPAGLDDPPAPSLLEREPDLEPPRGRAGQDPVQAEGLRRGA